MQIHIALQTNMNIFSGSVVIVKRLSETMIAET